ncbi:MAG: hypothetical protein J6Q13_00775 [Clostridia bacterium]|nr:hypothetical protein [Clostridia bacterium]
MNLQGCLSRRSTARKMLRNYIVENKEELEIEFGVEIPDCLKNMSGDAFSEWVFNNAKVFLDKRYDEDCMFHEIIDLVADLICCENNVTLAESVNSNNI